MIEIPRLLIFNFDSTLAEVNEYRANSLRFAIQSIGLPLSEDELNAAVSRHPGNYAALTSLFPELDEDRVNAILKFVSEKSECFLAKIRMYPEVIHVLQSLHAGGYLMALCSRQPENIVRTFVGGSEIEPLISFIVGTDGGEGAIPEVPSICAILRRLDLLPHQVAYIGGDDFDRQIASQCGVEFFLANRHLTNHRLPLYRVLRSLYARERQCTVNRNNSMSDDNDWMPHEYDALKKEIHQYQKFRLQILAVVVAALAIICSLPFRYSGQASSDFQLWTVLLTALSPYLLVIPGVYFTYLLSRHITYIGSYIHAYHEKALSRFGWETARKEYGLVDPKGKVTTQRSFAFFYWLFGAYSFFFSLSVGFKAFSEYDPLYRDPKVMYTLVVESPASHIVLLVFIFLNLALFLLHAYSVFRLYYGRFRRELKDRFDDNWKKVKIRQNQ